MAQLTRRRHIALEYDLARDKACGEEEQSCCYGSEPEIIGYLTEI